MKAVADIAGTYGVLFRPPDTTNEELMLGLIYNQNRTNARRVLNQAKAITIAMGEDNAIEIMDAAGVDSRTRLRARMEQLRKG